MGVNKTMHKTSHYLDNVQDYLLFSLCQSNCTQTVVPKQAFHYDPGSAPVAIKQKQNILTFFIRHLLCINILTSGQFKQKVL